MLKVAIAGHGRHGKDTVADRLAATTRLRYWGSCSRVILPHAARRLGLPEAEAWRTRHECREVWRALGDELRAHDPGFLARTVLKRGDVVCGVRSRPEMEAVLREGMVDVAVWVDRKGFPPDPTQEFGPELCHVVLQNHWGLAELHARVDALALSWGVLMRS